MEYLIGNKNEFYNFLNSIGKEDRVAIVSHNDLDGLASAIFLEEILKAKGLEGNLRLRKFLDYKKGIFLEVYDELKKKKISSVLILDLNPENVDLEGFERLRREFNVFSIDHHPVGELKDRKGIIKTETGYCAGFVCYELGKGILDSEKWKWLVHAAIVSDMSYKNLEVLKFLQKNYPEITEENIHESEIGKITSMITSSLIYFDKDVEKVYDLVRRKKIKELGKYDAEIKEEVDKWMRKYEEEAEFYPERNLYFYYFNPKFGVRSLVTTILSGKKLDKTFVSIGEVPEDKNILSVSMRNQSGKEDMNKLMKKGVSGMENAIGGGHVPAAGGRFMKKDLEKFKENIIS